MRITSFAQVCFGALMVAGAVAVACGGDNNPSNGSSGTSGTATGTSGTATGTAGTATGTAGTATGTAGTATGTAGTAGTATGTAGTATGTAGTATGTTGTATGTAGTASGTASDGGGISADAGVCPSTLEDKVTPCTFGTDVPCNKGCGPDLPAGSAQKNLGEKTCTCGSAGVYTCGTCIYESPLPGCYVAPATPPACAAGVADKSVCTTACTGNGTGMDVCQTVSDAGKGEGCVCITGSSGPVYTCATLPW